MMTRFPLLDEKSNGTTSPPDRVPRARQVIERALGDRDSGVRLAALSAFRSETRPESGALDELLRARLGDPDAEVRAEAALVLRAEGLHVLEEMARSEDVISVRAALRRIGPDLLWLAVERSNDSRGEIRAEAFGDTFPASTLVGVEALAVPGYLIEIEAVAVVP